MDFSSKFDQNFITMKLFACNQINFAIFFLLVLGLHSCVPYSPTAITPANNYSPPSYAVKKTDAKTWEIGNPKVYQIPLVATHEITGNRVKGTASIKTSEGTIEVSRNLAIADAVSKVPDSEQLVNPLFSSTIENGVITTEVTGFPAKIKDIRAFQVTDTSLFSAINKIEARGTMAEGKTPTLTSASMVQIVRPESAPEVPMAPVKPTSPEKKSKGGVLLLIFIPLAILAFLGFRGALATD